MCLLTVYIAQSWAMEEFFPRGATRGFFQNFSTGGKIGEICFFLLVRSGPENTLWFSIDGPGGFLLASGGPGCRSAGPCRL